MDIIVLVCAVVIILLVGVGLLLWFTKKNKPAIEMVIFHLRLPKENNYSVLINQEFYKKLDQFLRSNKTFVSLEIISGNYGIHYLVSVPNDYKEELQRIIGISFPDIQMDIVSDYLKGIAQTKKEKAIINLKSDDSFLKPFGIFHHAPEYVFNRILKILTQLYSNDEIYVQIILQSLKNFAIVNPQHDWLNDINQEALQKRSIEESFEANLRILTKADNLAQARLYIKKLSEALNSWSTINDSLFIPVVEHVEEKKLIDRFLQRSFAKQNAMRFTVSEISSLFMLPHQSVYNLEWQSENTQVVAPAPVIVSQTQTQDSTTIETAQPKEVPVGFTKVTEYPAKVEENQEDVVKSYTAADGDPLAAASGSVNPISADEYDRLSKIR